MTSQTCRACRRSTNLNVVSTVVEAQQEIESMIIDAEAAHERIATTATQAQETANELNGVAQRLNTVQRGVGDLRAAAQSTTEEVNALLLNLTNLEAAALHQDDLIQEQQQQQQAAHAAAQQ